MVVVMRGTMRTVALVPVPVWAKLPVRPPRPPPNEPKRRLGLREVVGVVVVGLRVAAVAPVVVTLMTWVEWREKGVAVDHR